MASKSITELDAIQLSQISSNDSFVLEHSNNAMRLTAQTFLAWAAEELDGHGGIQSVEKTSTEGLEDTYTITFGDGTTTSFIVKNGAKGDKGDTGDTGETGDPAVLESSAVAYQKSDDGTTPPTGTWSSTIPEIVSGEFLWTRTTLTFNTGSPVVFYSVSSAGQDGSGTGTVTSVGITAGAGMSVSGSPITSSGSIAVGHSNSVTAKTTSAIYPIKVDAQGHITATGTALSASNGLSMNGSSIGHSNSTTAKSTQDVYPISIDAYGHISSSGSAYKPAKSFTVTLNASSWSSKTQNVSNSNFIATGYAYTVAPNGNPTNYNAAKIYADNVTSNGVMTFHCIETAPTSNIVVNVMRVVSE